MERAFSTQCGLIPTPPSHHEALTTACRSIHINALESADGSNWVCNVRFMNPTGGVSRIFRTDR